MKPKFRESLETYQALAKDLSKKEKQTDVELKQVESALAWYMSHFAERTGGEVRTQEEIFMIQQEKQTRMAELKAQLKAIDAPEASFETKEDERFVEVRDGSYACNGTPITLGQILTDGEWGIRYALDPVTVPRSIRKKFVIEEAKRDLLALANIQIVSQELFSKHTDDGKRHAYGAFREFEGREEQVGGWVAERLVKNVLKKFAIDFDLDFEVVDTDVYEDVTNKIDFVIKRKSRTRGVAVQEGETPAQQQLGIQFTTNAYRENVAKKEKQLSRVRNRLDQLALRVEDVVLVTLPIGASKELLRQWKRFSRPGGPDELMHKNLRKAIFFNVLKDIFKLSELEAQWHLIESASNNSKDLAA